LAFAGGGLWFFFRDVDVGLFLDELKTQRLIAFVFCMGLAVASVWFRALRWRYFLPSSSEGHSRGLFGLVMIGFMANNILPARMGEAARALFLWRKNRYHPAAAIGSVILERYIDLLVFTAYFCIPILCVPPIAAICRAIPLPLMNNQVTLYHFAIVLCGVILAGMLPFLFYRLTPAMVHGIFRMLITLLPRRIRHRSLRFGQEFRGTLEWLFSARRCGLVVIHSVLTTFCFVLIVFLLVGDFSPLFLMKSVCAQAFAALGAAIPLSPGYIGTLHAVLLQGLTIMGLGVESGRAVTILYHACSYMPYTIIGLWFFFRTHISFREISHAKEELKETE
jgi:hypothetical protein